MSEENQTAKSDSHAPSGRVHPIVLQLEFGAWERMTSNVSASAIIAGGVRVGEVLHGYDGKYCLDWTVQVADTMVERCADFGTIEGARDFANHLWRRWVRSLLENSVIRSTEKGIR